VVDLMQATEFVQVGKDSRTGQPLYMNKNGDGTLYTKDQLKELYKKNNKELQKEVSKKEVKDDTIKETDKADK
jgi:phage terminase Nu1 subunit (DNA packaging protein)